MAHTLFHDVGVETLYTDYSIGYTVRPMHILFRPCGLTLNKRNDRQRSPTAIMQTNSPMCMRRVRINVVGVVLSINDRRKRVSGRGLCEPFTTTKFAAGHVSLAAAGGSCQSGNMAALLNSLVFVFRISFLPKYRVKYYEYIVKWCSGI